MISIRNTSRVVVILKGITLTSVSTDKNMTKNCMYSIPCSYSREYGGETRCF